MPRIGKNNWSREVLDLNPGWSNIFCNKLFTDFKMLLILFIKLMIKI